MGASGNMVMASLYELLPNKTAFIKKMMKLGLPGVDIKCTESEKCGITGTHISITVKGSEETSEDVLTVKSTHNSEHHEHHHHDHIKRTAQGYEPDTFHHKQDHKEAPLRHHKSKRYGYNEILSLIQGLDIPEKVKEDATGVYEILGTAEASVHGKPLDKIHFHEVGSLDAIADVVGCSLLMDMLGVKYVTASPVNTGFGMVRCEHGTLPVPAPATAEILKGIPMYAGNIEGELCTPTGAALLKYFVTGFGAMPPISVKKIGYGMGTKNYEAANCLRVYFYDDAAISEHQDYICEISCNLDDMSPEAIGAAFDLLLGNGALDVYVTPVFMKKNRPAVILSCLCPEDAHERIAKLMIAHTSTLGVRTTMHYRTIMDRTTESVQTEYGLIRIKCAQGFGITKRKPEYEDVLEAAKINNVSFQTVYEAAMRGI